MGTRGLWAYRWRRRYYTTYNHSDSYPSGLGSSLVARIPSDPAEFAAWLEDLKWQLENRADGTEDPPKLDLFAEWTYVIDFDRLVFTVNGRSHIQLDKLPRSTATEEEEDAEDWPFFSASCEWTSALNKNHPASIEPSSPIKPSAEHVALYDAVHASEVSQPVSMPNFPFTTCGVLMDQLFRNFCFVYGARIIAEEQPDHPTFLAAARGIVALATWGDFEFTDTPLKEDHTYRERSDIHPEWTSAQSSSTHFWHRGVLFVLDSGLEDASQLRGAVGRAVHLWREDASSHKRTVAFILTLRDLVQVDLSDPQNVKHTSPLLLAADDDIDQRSGFPVKMEFAPVSPGFALLKAVLTPVLPASGSLSGPSRFPLDVLDRVLDWCDTETLDAMGETCKTVRALRLHRPRVDIGPYRLLHSHSPPDGVFTALDAYGDTTSVLVGGLRFDDYGKEDGCGYNLRLSTGTETAGERTGAVAKLIGLSVSAVEKEASETVA